MALLVRGGCCLGNLPVSGLVCDDPQCPVLALGCGGRRRVRGRGWGALSGVVIHQVRTPYALGRVSCRPRLLVAVAKAAL